jgi:hypothetical protein
MWSRIWTGYLATAALAFAVIEYLGLRSRNRGGPNGTLTCFVRKALHIDPVGRHHRWGKAALVGFAGWLVVHFLTGRWPN